MRGIAIKLQNYEQQSAVDVLNIHLRTARENGGRVYFSTNLRISSRQGNITQLLICFPKPSGSLGYLQADIVKILQGDRQSFIPPEDAATYSPEEYADTPCATWLLIQNLRRADPQFLSQIMVTTSNGENVHLTEIFTRSPRLNRVYWWTETSDDGLIF